MANNHKTFLDWLSLEHTELWINFCATEKFTTRKWLITFDYKIYRTEFAWAREPIRERERKRERKTEVLTFWSMIFLSLFSFLGNHFNHFAHIHKCSSVQNPLAK